MYSKILTNLICQFEWFSVENCIENSFLVIRFDSLCSFTGLSSNKLTQTNKF